MHKIRFYSLSTCIWCRKTRNYMNENHIQYDEITIDQLVGETKEKALSELAKYNPIRSFPTLVFLDGSTVIGFKPDEIRKALDKK
jgi:glutaredoxin-like protein NrdH